MRYQLLFIQRGRIRFQEYAHQLPRVGDEVYAVNRKGDDPTEIYDIHKYQEGDQLKNIHWKLSARYQDILVKDNAMLVGEVINLYVSFDDNDDHNDLVFWLFLIPFCGFFIKTNKLAFYYQIRKLKVFKNMTKCLNICYGIKSISQIFLNIIMSLLLAIIGIMKVEGGR